MFFGTVRQFDYTISLFGENCNILANIPKFFAPIHPQPSLHLEFTENLPLKTETFIA
jgi:hypothetical protein